MVCTIFQSYAILLTNDISLLLLMWFISKMTVTLTDILPRNDHIPHYQKDEFYSPEMSRRNMSILQQRISSRIRWRRLPPTNPNIMNEMFLTIKTQCITDDSNNYFSSTSSSSVISVIVIRIFLG
jgi:hypothetical protein